jgi:ATP-dependent DNA ligase
MPGRAPVPMPADRRDWAPMRPYRGRRQFDIRDPLLEPLWSGTRALAHLSVTPQADAAVTVTIVAEGGIDLSAELPLVTSAIASSFLALEAVIDGVVSRQVTLDGIGAAAIPEVRSRPTEMFVRSNLDFDVTARGAIVEAAAEAEPLDGFIAVDLLWLDGTSLLDVPLLERKRLLESVIAPSQLVRVSSHVRPPIDSWIATWKGMGLRGGMLKAANSRYHPSDDTIEWRSVERLNRRS